MITPSVLVENIKKYNPDIDEDYIRKAYIFALDCHGTQLRDSGEPYFSHPLEVASMLAELKMDTTTIVAGLLHDTVEDTSTTTEDIKHEFGEEVASIVSGVTKLSQVEVSPLAEKQVENFKKLLISSSSDIRVLVIKLIDRLHNIRTLNFCTKQKRQKIAKETLEIYVPLAARIGMTTIKEELQDISFAELFPEVYSSIRNKLKDLYAKSVPVIDMIVAKLKNISDSIDIKSPIIKGRMKTPYSIWQKLNRRSISFDQLADIMAFRIIVENTNECYLMLGAIHEHYIVIPGGFRDYISTPKSNGYQSLHTSVIGPFNKRIEIQIRTIEMHNISEYGVAAHWYYKQVSDNRKNSWLKELAETLEYTSGIEEFLEVSKNERLSEKIFCVTPTGKIISLPKGASVLDFAYAIGERIGNQAKKAMVNGKEAPLKTILKNGDSVSIITDPKSKPQNHWKNYVITIKAKACIQKALQISKQQEQISSSKYKITYAACCMPVPGDRVVGLVNVLDNSREIHIENCQLLNNKILQNNEKITSYSWEQESNKHKYKTKFLLTINYTSGNITNIIKIIEQESREILAFQIEENLGEFLTFNIELMVSNIEHLRSIKAVLRNCDFVISVERIQQSTFI